MPRNNMNILTVMNSYSFLELDKVSRGDLPPGLPYQYFNIVGEGLILAFEPGAADSGINWAKEHKIAYRCYNIKSAKADPFAIPSVREYLENQVK